jgi:hypothetical protein
VLHGELDVGDVGLGLVLHREPTRRGQLKASALTVEDSQNCALTDLVSCRIAGIKRGDATRKDSEISYARESYMKAGAQTPSYRRACGPETLTPVGGSMPTPCP